MQVNNVDKSNNPLAKQNNEPTIQNDAILKNLNKQLLDIKNKLLALADNKHLSDKQKKATRDNLNKQLSEIKQQISNRELAIKKAKEDELKAKKEEERAKQKIDNPNVDYKAEKEKSEFANFVSVTNSLSDIKTQRLTKLNMEKSATRMRTEIEYDEERGLDVPEKREKLKDINEKIAKLNEKISENMGKINKELKEQEKELKVLHKQELKQKLEKEDKKKKTDKAKKTKVEQEQQVKPNTKTEKNTDK